MRSTLKWVVDAVHRVVLQAQRYVTIGNPMTIGAPFDRFLKRPMYAILYTRGIPTFGISPKPVPGKMRLSWFLPVPPFHQTHTGWRKLQIPYYASS